MKIMFLMFLLLFFIPLHRVVAEINADNYEIHFENLLPGGYAEKVLTESEDDRIYSFSAIGSIKKWLFFDINKDNLSVTKIIVKPPAGTLVGKYVGYIILEKVATGDGLTGAISTPVALKTTIDITDKEIRQATVKNISVQNIEKESPIKILAIIVNEGNIKANITVHAAILDKDKKELIRQSNSATALPSTSSSIKIKIPNDLETGQHWANITILFDGMLLRKELISFHIVERGMLPAKQESAVFIEPAIPLASDWAVIILWLIILLAVTFVITKSKKNES